MYKGMQNRILKNYQVNLGAPFQIHPGFEPSAVSFDCETGDNGESSIDGEKSNNPEDILKAAREEALAIIREAELESERMLEKAEEAAREKAAGIEEEAWKNGFEKGLAEGKAQYDDLVNEAELIRENARAEYGEILASIEAETVEVIIEIAKKVIGNELVENRENILQLMRQAFEKCENKAEGVTIRVSADDYDYVISNRGKIFSMAEGIGEFEIKKDHSLKQGSCVLDSPYGSIDSGVNTRLKKIEEAFSNALSK